MIDGEVDSATVITTDTIIETRKDGTKVEKKIFVPLYAPKPMVTVEQAAKMQPSGYEPDEPVVPVDFPSPQQEREHTYQVSIHLKCKCSL